MCKSTVAATWKVKFDMTFEPLGNVAFDVLSELTQTRFAERERAFENLRADLSTRRNNWGRGGSSRTESIADWTSRSYATGRNRSGSKVFRS